MNRTCTYRCHRFCYRRTLSGYFMPPLTFKFTAEAEGLWRSA